MLPFATPTAILLSLWLSAVPSAPEAGNVTGMQILPATERTEVIIAVNGEVSARDFTMEGPHRVVVDIEGARYAMAGRDFPAVNRGGVRSIQASQYSDNIVRIVLELEEPRGYALLQGEGFVRLSLENPRGGFEPWEADAGVPEPAGQGVPAVAEVAGVPQGGGAGNGGGVWVDSASDEFAQPITVSFTGTPMRDVLFTFAEFSGRSIVPGSGVSGTVNASIREQPWDIALQTILESHGLAAREYASGIIRVDRLQDLSERTEVEQLVTRPFRINYAGAQEMVSSVEGLLSGRGRVNVNSSTNSLVVTDVPGVLESIETLLEGLDLQTPEITISAKIIFVNRTDLEELGIVYDLRDVAETGMRIPEVGAPLTLVGDDVVAPGTGVAVRGDAIAAIGRAGETVSDPSLAILTQLVLGRFSLVSFVTALESLQMSDIQAHPQVRVLDNRPARIHVGERTPVRGVQSGQQQQQEGLFFGPPQIEFVETGIILEVTPTVTTGDLIFMDLLAERSGVEVISEQLGYQFNTQEAQTQVLVQDGETVVIGGLTATEVEQRRVGIPILQHLPVVGRLFGYTAETRSQQDLIILVTPQINRR